MKMSILRLNDERMMKLQEILSNEPNCPSNTLLPIKLSLIPLSYRMWWGKYLTHLTNCFDSCAPNVKIKHGARG